ncbi:putative plastid-lipid-associated protein 2, chloroplastic [Dichanthelium oligosanthes]|uniref:Putative plastid-lipid-associated protein 2, chloroplastic n=1 Tax=Dichanthelium oligosanthes TaxID=888268 RepID=A0A1E5VYD4_9POAL|nr:putative plastid-lipid-associated protein 2, chloroplastic [Dichanthelium oligosanthes]
MAGVASLNALALRAPSPSPAAPSPSPRHRGAGALAFPGPPRFPSLRAARRVLPARAAAGGDAEDEWGPEPDGGPAVTAAVAEAPAPEASEVAELKARLKEALYGTERGLRASSETRADVVELITQLEARNPTPAPTEALTLLNGKWILAYTSFSQLFPLLGSGRLPELVKVEEISQTIDSENLTVQNCIKFSGPLATTSVSTNAKFEIRSPKRVQIKIDEGVIGTPQLTDSIVLPEKFELLGQNIDLSPLKGIFSSIENAASSVAKTISGQPPLKIPFQTNNAESWLLTTYLDEELRISRGDGSSIFVLFKEGSTLLN